MVEGDLDFDLSQDGTLILKYYQVNVQNAVLRTGFQIFWILCSPRLENFEITLESWPLFEGDFDFNLSQKGTFIFFTKNDLSPLGFLKTVLTSEI